MKKSRIVILALYLWFLFGCNFSDVNGKRIFINDPYLSIVDSIYYHNDQKFSGCIISASNPALNELLIQVHDGKLHGSYKTWFPLAVTPKMHKNYYNGLEHGEQKGWHHGGTLY